MPKRSEANITSRAAEASPPGLLWDREVPGFGLRTLASGARTWLFKYRALDGRQHWHRIGTFPAITTEEARKAARRLRAAVDHGKNPSKEREVARQTARAARAASVEALAEHYAKALEGRPSLRGSGAISADHAAAEAAAVRNAIARMKLEGRPVAEITPADLLRLLHMEAARPATARMLFGAFGRFLEWCRETGHVPVNVCDAIPRAKRPKPPPARRRVVALADIARLWHAAGSLHPTLRDLARVLFVVPVRRGEAARLDWRDVDFGNAVWTLPAAITKNGDPHRVALPPLAVAILRERHHAAGAPGEGLAFPSPLAGVVVMGWTRMKAEISAVAGFSAWTWHDLRRSFVSIMAERGISEPVADAVLNHRRSGTRGGVLGVYQVAERWPDQREAMMAWGLALADAIAPAPKGKRRATEGASMRGTGAVSVGAATPPPPAEANALRTKPARQPRRATLARTLRGVASASDNAGAVAGGRPARAR